MLRDEGISGSEPARRAPGRAASGLILGLALALAWPACGQVDDDRNDSATSLEGSGREEAAKEVRPALARRKRNALNQFQFDPKVFEARGRELQGEYYEITSYAKGGTAWSSNPAVAEAPEEAETRATRSKASATKNWMIWGGAAGLAAVVGGAAGYLLLEKHTAPTPVSVDLNDDPESP